jgi:hypothetical protein
MKRPNLSILGALKCGTNSLAAWLADHRSVHVHPQTLRVSWFWCADLARLRKIDT